MKEVNYTLREAMADQGVTYAKLVDALKKSRQTLSRYVTVYERDGKVSDSAAQAEFDRIMAEQELRMIQLNSDRSMEEIEKAKERNQAEERLFKRDYESFLRRILTNHPDFRLLDWNDEPVTLDNLNLENAWVNRPLEIPKDVLTDDEIREWDELYDRYGGIMFDRFEYNSEERSHLLEKLWDSIIVNGKPRVYTDKYESAITAEESGGVLYDFSSKSFCQFAGDSARIYMWDLTSSMGMESDLEFSVTIWLIIEGGVIPIQYVDMIEKHPGYFHVADVEGLFPGYKYLYSININSANDPRDLDITENSLVEGYFSTEHPLK